MILRLFLLLAQPFITVQLNWMLYLHLLIQTTAILLVPIFKSCIFNIVFALKISTRLQISDCVEFTRYFFQLGNQARSDIALGRAKKLQDQKATLRQAIVDEEIR